MELRPYQTAAIDAIISEWEKIQKTLLVLPTGTGKTIVFCKLSERMICKGKRILILAHRGELLDQAADKMMKATGLGCAIEKAELTAEDSWFRTTVGSVQTLMSEKRLERFSPDFYDIIITDEAHHCLSPSYQVIYDYFKDAKHLGVTATPDRGDKQDLGQFFDSLAYEYTLPEAINDGFLSPIKALSIPINIDLNACSQQAGDFKARDLGNVLDPFLEAIADEMAEHCKDRKTVIFLPLIATSKKMCEILNKKGFRATEINGTSKDRSENLNGFTDGKFNVICNSMLLTEGWDEPSADCIVCLRPTKIRALYAQIIGRGTRLYPGKEYLLVLDFLWHSDRHQLCRPANLVCEDPEMAAAMTKIIQEQEEGKAVDISDISEEVRQQVIDDREERLAKKLEEMRHRKRQLVDPIQFEMSIRDEKLLNYEPAFGDENSAVTPSQKKKLEKMGIFSEDIQNKGLAESLIKKLDERRIGGFTTPKQIRCLERYGFRDVGTWKFLFAKSLIDRIAGNRWKIPKDIEPYSYKPKTEIKSIDADFEMTGW